MSYMYHIIWKIKENNILKESSVFRSRFKNIGKNYSSNNTYISVF